MSSYPPPPPPPPPGPPPPGGYYAPGGQTSGKATTILILGIMSLVLCATCGIGFILGIIALAKAPGAVREIQQSGGRLTGEGFIKAGRICSWISVIAGIVGIIAFVLLIAFGDGSFDVETNSSPGSVPSVIAPLH